MFRINKRNEPPKDENDSGRLFYLNLVEQLTSLDSQLKSYAKLEITKILIILNGSNCQQHIIRMRSNMELILHNKTHPLQRHFSSSRKFQQQFSTSNKCNYQQTFQKFTEHGIRMPWESTHMKLLLSLYFLLYTGLLQ